MQIDMTKQEQALTFILNGRLDSLTAGDLEAAINENLTPDISSLTLDMKDVDYISSKGLRVLVATYRKLNDRPFMLSKPDNAVKEVLRLSGLLKIFTILD